MGVNWMNLQLPQEVLDLEAANKRLEAMEANLETMESKMQSLIGLLKSKGATEDELQAVLAGMSA